MESRVELERRLKLAEEALRDLEQGLNAVERTSERDERMRGDVSHLRSEFNQYVHQIHKYITLPVFLYRHNISFMSVF